MPHTLRWRTVSYKHSAADTETLRLSIVPPIGMRATRSQRCLASRRMPARSAPITQTMPVWCLCRARFFGLANLDGNFQGNAIHQRLLEAYRKARGQKSCIVLVTGRKKLFEHGPFPAGETVFVAVQQRRQTNR